MPTLTIDIPDRVNFHNARATTIRYTDSQLAAGEDGNDIILLTPSQARRLDKHFCGFTDCCCGSSPVFTSGYTREGYAGKTEELEAIAGPQAWK